MTPRLSSFATVRTFLKVGTCSEAMGHVLDRAFGHPSKPEESATAPLAGGILQHGYQCGLIWGAALAAGAQSYRCLGSGPEAEAAALRAAQSLVSSFRTRNGEINCLELTECDWRKPSKVMKYLVKGGTIKCFRMAARFPPVAYDDIRKAMAAHPPDAPVFPVSCTAELARRLGASDLQAMMAAGWAGGIGLSGGACGALGVAIWISGLARLKGGARRVKMVDPAASKIVDRFVPCAGYEFECSKIVGRTFTSVADHADYIKSGGCAKILATLAAGPAA
ncbi:MAG: C-GCAxxG-C-C family protein [Candidatus Aminicenantes bacterium]|nr:C-GCAxxG-C-C family protein [Candidatus Aminicenantes bacterium]